LLLLLLLLPFCRGNNTAASVIVGVGCNIVAHDGVLVARSNKVEKSAAGRIAATVPVEDAVLIR